MALAKMIACLVEGRPFELHGDGTQSRSFTYVDDAVEATILAMERGQRGRRLNVGGGEEVSVLQAIETLAEVSGRRLELVRAARREGDAARTVGRHDAHPRRDRLGAADPVRRGPRGSVALGR